VNVIVIVAGKDHSVIKLIVKIQTVQDMEVVFLDNVSVRLDGKVMTALQEINKSTNVYQVAPIMDIMTWKQPHVSATVTGLDMTVHKLSVVSIVEQMEFVSRHDVVAMLAGRVHYVSN
jgi:hypothetical protein